MQNTSLKIILIDNQSPQRLFITLNSRIYIASCEEWPTRESDRQNIFLIVKISRRLTNQNWLGKRKGQAKAQTEFQLNTIGDLDLQQDYMPFPGV
jgi:hypothetical protein